MLKPKHAVTAWKGYSMVKGTVEVVTKPLTWIRGKIRDVVISAAVKMAVFLVGEKLANSAVGKVSEISKDVEFSIPVPEKLRKSILEEGDMDKIITDLANDAMCAPLALIGCKVGELQAKRNEDASKIDFFLKFQLEKTK